jgi:hypothetical protein
LDKDSGAPALRAFKFDFKSSTGIKDIKPIKTQLMDWQDSSFLWIVTAGAALGDSW